MDKERPGQAGVIKTLMEVLGIYVLIPFAARWASITVQLIVHKLLAAIQAGGTSGGRGWLKGSLPDPSLIQVGHLGPGIRGFCRRSTSFPAWGVASLLTSFSWKVPGCLLPWAGPSYGSSILSSACWCSQTICLGVSE